MNEINSRLGLLAERKSLLESMMEEQVKPDSEYVKLQERIAKIAEIHQKETNKKVLEIAGPRNSMLKLSILLDEGDENARKTLIKQTEDVFEGLDFMAREVAKSIKNSDKDKASNIAELAASDNNAISDHLWAIAEYINAIDKDYVRNKNDRNLNILSDKKRWVEIPVLESEIKKDYSTRTQHELYSILALKQIIKHMNTG